MSMQVIQHLEAPSGGSASFTFSVIPQTFTHLYLAYSTRNEANQAIGDIAINGTTTNRSYRYLTLYNGSVSTNSDTFSFFTEPSSAAASIHAITSTLIPNYTSSSTKSFSTNSTTEWAGAFAYTSMHAETWDTSSPITSLTITVRGGDLEQYSSATLYGILAGSNGSTTIS